MTPLKLIQAILYPLTSAAVLVPLIVFWLLTAFAAWGGLLGLFLMAFVLLAVVRFLMMVLEARARGAEPETPGIEFFSVFGDGWNLFPAALVLLFGWIIVAANDAFGIAWSTAVSVLVSIVFPASLAVLAVTRSPLQSINPVAILRLLERCGRTLWIAIVFAELAGWLAYLGNALPSMLASFIQMYLWFAYASLLGSLIEPYNLFEEIGIPEPLEKTADEIAGDVEKRRVGVLGHAYGFISRDNREGGFRHILAEIARDPDPAGAWAWYFGRMLQWENNVPALFFGQHYVHDALRHGEEATALKVAMRCRLEDPGFRPLAEDRAMLLAAAQRSSNSELAEVLRMG
ncbi:MAG: hypothetical protein KJO56_09635 [Gammaproteobacteria bacterium]|nr:hypothetical protein [Gammaproteobacteria bacterium]